VLVPTGFLTLTGTAVGDWVTIGLAERQLRVRIVGELFDNTNDGVSMVMGWSTLSRIDAGVVPTQFDVGLRPGTSAGGYAHTLADKLGSAYYVSLNARNHKTIDAMIGLITVLTLLLAAVAALGVVNTVVLNTRERVHDLAIFKALGMSPRQMIVMVVSSVAGVGLVAGIVAVPIGIAIHHKVLPAMAASVGMRLPATIIAVYSARELIVLALAGVLIAVAGALPPAGCAAKTGTAIALHTE
jgi:putative ABC transport system permease protein